MSHYFQSPLQPLSAWGFPKTRWHCDNFRCSDRFDWYFWKYYGRPCDAHHHAWRRQEERQRGFRQADGVDEGRRQGGIYILKWFHITDSVAKGIAIGTSSHAMGTAKAIEMGEVEGAMSGLSIAVAGMITVIGANIFSIFY